MAAALRDMKVFGVGKRLDGRFVMVSVYRDCARLYLSAYSSETSMTRFAWTRDDLEHVSELLVPSGLDTRDPRPRPETAREVYARLVELLRFDAGALSHRLELSARRERVRLLRQVRKVDSAYVVVTTYEEGRGNYTVIVHIGSTCEVITLPVRERVVAHIAATTPTPDERAVLESGDVRGIGRVITDRVTLKKRRTTEASQASVRTTGEGGAVLFKVGRKIGGVLRVVTVFETAGAMAVQVYTPASQSEGVIRLGPVERLLLLGRSSAAARRAVFDAVCARLAALPRQTVALRGVTLALPPSLPDVITFDRAATRTAFRLGNVLVQGALEVVTPDGGVDVVIYHPPSSVTYRLRISRAQMQQLFTSWESSLLWPPKSASGVGAAAKLVFSHLRWTEPAPSGNAYEEAGVAGAHACAHAGVCVCVSMCVRVCVCVFV